VSVEVTLTAVLEVDPLIDVATPVVEVWSTKTVPAALVEVAVNVAVAVVVATRAVLEVSNPLAVAVLVVEVVRKVLLTKSLHAPAWRFTPVAIEPRTLSVTSTFSGVFPVLHTW